MHKHREKLVTAIEAVKAGRRLSAWTDESVFVPNMCAQTIREPVEGNVERPWKVAQAANVERAKRNWHVRWAKDYMLGLLALGLQKPVGAPLVIGDVLFWPYTGPDNSGRGAYDFHHIALYAGQINGEDYILENTGWKPHRMVQAGAIRVLGEGTYIYLTPMRLRGAPLVVGWATAELRDAELQAAAPAAPPSPAEAGAVPATELTFPVQAEAASPAPVVIRPIEAGSDRRVLLSVGHQPFENITGKRFEVGNVSKFTINAAHDGPDVWIRAE